jgi:type I site-specific restriction-modification system R (restriction) subunit
VFDSFIVVTDRRLLDRQIRDTIKQFAQVGATVGHAEHSGDLRKFIESGKKIIISTVQKFPFILERKTGAKVDELVDLYLDGIATSSTRFLTPVSRCTRTCSMRTGRLTSPVVEVAAATRRPRWLDVPAWDLRRIATLRPVKPCQAQLEPEGFQ